MITHLAHRARSKVDHADTGCLLALSEEQEEDEEEEQEKVEN